MVLFLWTTLTQKKKKQCHSSFLFIYGIILVNYFNPKNKKKNNVVLLFYLFMVLFLWTTLTKKKKNNVILLFYLFPPFVAVGKFMDLGQFYNITLKKKKKKKKKCLGEGFV